MLSSLIDMESNKSVKRLQESEIHVRSVAEWANKIEVRKELEEELYKDQGIRIKS